jgi:hypothetical protein
LDYWRDVYTLLHPTRTQVQAPCIRDEGGRQGARPFGRDGKVSWPALTPHTCTGEMVMSRVVVGVSC